MTFLRAGLLNREVDLAILLEPVADFVADNIDMPGVELAWCIAADADDTCDDGYFQPARSPAIAQLGA